LRGPDDGRLDRKTGGGGKAEHASAELTTIQRTR
jgi:hypothetical protein